MRALITGSEGFVGKYLREELERNGYEVTGVDLRPGTNTMVANLTNAHEVDAIFSQVKPDVVFHLAGQADVAKSWKIPAETFELNVVAAVNLMEAMRKWNPQGALLLVGSSDEYGSLGEKGNLVSEQTPLSPFTPYAISKMAQEHMGQTYARAYKMKIFMTRSFNHCGAGQRKGFMIPDFASGIADVEKGVKKTVSVGNLTSKRDFTHVRDVVRAYRLIVEKGKPGEIYNVGSGAVHSAQEILDRLIAMAQKEIQVESDPARMRPSDTPVICCDRTKLTQHTGWIPEYTIDDILRDTLEYYRHIES